MGTNYINLREPGSSHTLRVQSVDINKSGKWPDYEFTDGTNTVQIPQKAADRQLARLNVKTAFELVGATLCISRTEKTGDNGKPFWDLALVNAAAAIPTPSRRLPPPESRTTKTAHRAGPDIPGMDEAMEEDGPPAHWDDVPMPDDGDGPQTYVQNNPAEPPLIPREVREREAQAKGEPSEADGKRAVCVSRYLEVYASVYGGLVAIHQAAGSSTTVPHGRATDLAPLSSETIHAAASTIYIEQGKQGLNR